MTVGTLINAFNLMINANIMVNIKCTKILIHKNYTFVITCMYDMSFK